MGPCRTLVLMALLTGTVACGYALAGRGNALPTHIKTIGVPNFVNHSTIPEIEIAFTDAVRTEFQSRGRYRMQPEAPGADAVLTGIVINASQQPLTRNSNNQASSYTFTITTNVEFKDVIDDIVLWANPAFRSTDEYQVPPASGGNPADLSSLFTQLPNALERLAKKFAREVVSSIFEAF